MNDLDQSFSSNITVKRVAHAKLSIVAMASYIIYAAFIKIRPGKMVSIAKMAQDHRTMIAFDRVSMLQPQPSGSAHHPLVVDSLELG